MLAKLPIKDGSATVRQDHVDHYIDTLDDRDLADHLVLCTVADSADLESLLRARQRSKKRHERAALTTDKVRAKLACQRSPDTQFVRSA